MLGNERRCGCTEKTFKFVAIYRIYKLTVATRRVINVLTKSKQGGTWE